MRVMERMSLLAPRDEELSFDVYQLHQKFLPVPPKELLEAEAKRVKEELRQKKRMEQQAKEEEEAAAEAKQKAEARQFARGVRRGDDRVTCCCVARSAAAASLSAVSRGVAAAAGGFAEPSRGFWSCGRRCGGVSFSALRGFPRRASRDC